MGSSTTSPQAGELEGVAVAWACVPLAATGQLSADSTWLPFCERPEWYEAGSERKMHERKESLPTGETEPNHSLLVCKAITLLERAALHALPDTSVPLQERPHPI